MLHLSYRTLRKATTVIRTIGFIEVVETATCAMLSITDSSQAVSIKSELGLTHELRFTLLCVLILMFGFVVGLWSCSQSALRTTVLCDVAAVCCVSCLHHCASGGTTFALCGGHSDSR